ncbi:unnamed protein product [Sordaria macrospora k-hell]|uniref:WGS project CABT00000000 data, contig 2.4 n=1 Tax=Sordaria macrospora (strain ATCC MYA-333 / DSM 997 / K(L3346) / K-hell) TaxID=771870 RepID=F7VQW0_SORMK|nr:uncharacterized protein SMAC_01457 [Sordaria macrospora k-hell]CCC07893.1 unnamed protein product [Sordaria macrospora k-hell]
MKTSTALINVLPLLLSSATASPVPVPAPAGPVISLQQSPNSTHVLSATFLTDDLPTGCTNTSLHDMHWTVSDFHYSSSLTYTTPSHRVNGATVKFNLTSNALPELNVYCVAYSTDYMDPFYGQRVYDCSTVINSTSGGEVKEGFKTQFRYWKSIQAVEVRQRWECDDLAEGPGNMPGNMAVFSANGTSANQTPNCTFEEHQTPPAEWKNGMNYYWNIQNCDLPEFSFVPSELQVFAHRAAPYYPPSIAQNITDGILSKTSHLQIELAKLRRTLGHEVIVEADWQRILDEYGEQEEPSNGIVGLAAHILLQWSSELRVILGRSGIDDWLTSLLDCVVEAGGKLRVMLDLWEDIQLGTTWSEERKGFFVHLPKHYLFAKKAYFSGNNSVREGFRKGLLSCNFQATEEGKKKNLNPEPEKGAGTAKELELGLAQLGVRDENSVGEGPSAPAAACDATTAATSKTTTTATSSSTEPTPTPFPTVDSLPSLVELCSKPPYHLTIQEHPSCIIIFGSHGRSIKLIDLYISKWTPDVVMNSADTPPTGIPPAVDGILHDVMSELTIDKSMHVKGSRRPLSMTMPMVLAIVEGTLGYRVVWQGRGEYRLRRDAPFV